MLKRLAKISLIMLALSILGACSFSKPFNSEEWLAGSVSSRGTMTQDLIDRRILIGKSKIEIEKLLGKPDSQGTDWYGYKVVTISRCYFWECSMGLRFDENTKEVSGVSISD